MQKIVFSVPLGLMLISWNAPMTRVVWNGSEPISCTDRACVAVGGYNMDGVELSSRVPFTMFSSDLGKTFGKGMQAPLPTKADLADGAQLTSVNCKGTHCVAVGGYGMQADLVSSPQTMSGTPLAMTSNNGGQTFTGAYQPPLPTGGDTTLLSHLAGITCNADDCIGVGQYNFNIAESNGVGLGYIVVSHDGGATFSSAFEPLLPSDHNTNRDARLFGVSCSGTNCVAVGKYMDQDGASLPLAVFSSDGGNTFTVASSPELPNDVAQTEKYGSLYAVSCNNEQRCIAIGSYSKYSADNSNPRTPFVTISYDGGQTFTTHYALNVPADATAGTHAQFNGISCSSASNCTAVGTYNIEVNLSDSMGYTGGLPFVANSTDGGESFVVSSDVNIPNTTDAGNVTQLNGISCGYYCVAVGSYNMTIEYTNPKSGTAFTVFNKKMGKNFSDLFIPALPDNANPYKGSVFGYGNIGL